MSARFQKGAQLEKRRTSQIMTRAGAASWMQMRFTVNAPVHRDAPRKVEGQMGLDFYLQSGDATEIQAFLAALMRFV